MDNKDKINELEIELDCETQTRLYWQKEAEYWYGKFKELSRDCAWHNIRYTETMKGVKQWKPTIE